MEGCPETSVKYYQFSLRKIPEKCSSAILRGGSLKTQIDSLALRIYLAHTCTLKANIKLILMICERTDYSSAV